MYRCSAISRFVRPLATSTATRNSERVSCPATEVGPTTVPRGCARTFCAAQQPRPRTERGEGRGRELDLVTRAHCVVLGEDLRGEQARARGLEGCPERVEVLRGIPERDACGALVFGDEPPHPCFHAEPPPAPRGLRLHGQVLVQSSRGRMPTERDVRLREIALPPQHPRIAD